ncbi:MAG: hypothetical protein M0Z66_09280 [Thermaerobacter sp.]|nr:hypothetical protein [Thermaerobacter sp.]
MTKEQIAQDLPVRMSQILSALSRALGLRKGQPFGHAARCC